MRSYPDFTSPAIPGISMTCVSIALRMFVPWSRKLSWAAALNCRRSSPAAEKPPVLWGDHDQSFSDIGTFIAIIWEGMNARARKVCCHKSSIYEIIRRGDKIVFLNLGFFSYNVFLRTS